MNIGKGKGLSMSYDKKEVETLLFQINVDWNFGIGSHDCIFFHSSNILHVRATENSLVYAT